VSMQVFYLPIQGLSHLSPLMDPYGSVTSESESPSWTFLYQKTVHTNGI